MVGMSKHTCRGCREAVPKSELMRLIPCQCVLCKDCLIEFLFAVCSKKLDLECCACRQPVTSLHVTVCQPTCRSEKYSATTNDGNTDFSKADDQISDEENKAAAQTNKRKRRANGENEERKWKEKFEQLKAYKERFGDCLVPSKWSENKKLSVWVSNQRGRNKKGLLSPERKEELDAIGFAWRGRSRQIEEEDDGTQGDGEHKPRKRRKRSPANEEKKKVASFEQRFEMLTLFKSKYGHCRVKFSDKEFKSLYRWSYEVRTGNKEITEEQRKQLVDLGFDFDSARKVHFNDRITALESFKAKYGHCKVTLEDENYKGLYLWLMNLRNCKVKLSPEQRQQLTDLGFSFDYMSKRMTFEDRVNDLLSFKKEHGHCYVPYRCNHPKGLGEWVKNIRRGATKVTKEQRKRLNEINFVWETGMNRRNREWRAKFDKLLDYKNRHGNCMVPWNWKEDRRLSDWVHTQKKEHSKGNMKPERKELLDSIGFTWGGRGRGYSSTAPRRNQEPQQANNIVAYQYKDDDDDDDDDSEDDDDDSEDDENDNIHWDNTHWQNAVQQGLNAVQQGFVVANEYPI